MTVWHTAKTAGEHVKLHTNAIREAVKDGELQAHPVGKTGREYRLREEDVDAWMTSRSFEPRSA